MDVPAVRTLWGAFEMRGPRRCRVGLVAVVVWTVALFVFPSGAAGPQEPVSEEAELPYVYTRWTPFTLQDGLPNDHVFCVEAAGSRVWIGTEDGLALLDKNSGSIRSWREKDGLPWRVISSLAFDGNTGDLWIGLFGKGLARFSGGRFDHWHQLNSGLVNDVVYGVAVEGDHVWAATTAGASRLNIRTGEWTIFTEKNAPMEEIWNYAVTANDGKVYLGVWGSGVLEFDTAAETWRVYLDPDGEMEIDLYRDDGLVHVITTGVSFVDQVLWVGTYFGGSRYDGRHWRGYFAHECGLPSDFVNAIQGRSGSEAWFSTDKGLGVLADSVTDTWVTYTLDPDTLRGNAVVGRGIQELERVPLDRGIPHNYVLWTEIDGDDVWVATAKGLVWGRGEGYYPGLKKRSVLVPPQQESKKP